MLQGKVRVDIVNCDRVLSEAGSINCRGVSNDWQKVRRLAPSVEAT